MNYKIKALNWVRKHGRSNTDYLTALHAIEFEIDNAMQVAETKEDIDLCELAKIHAARVLHRDE